MPPRYLRRTSPTRLKKCAEFPIEVCDKNKADGCCGVLPCKLCLEYETYADGISHGSAEFGSASWTGTVGGISFTAYWERNYESGECEFVVIFGGEEVYRSDCYGGASCRNPTGEAATEINYEAGTLRWSVYEPRELELIDDPETGCRTHFCGSCHCSCECLCVTITEYGGDVITGELCDVAYPCDAPTWAGSIGYYDLSLTLGRDQYGECIITPTIDGVELEPVAAPGCGSMSATFTDADGNVFEVACKECSCTQGTEDCCYPRCEPLKVNQDLIEVPGDCDNPLPLTLTCDLTATPTVGSYTCFNGSLTLTFRTPLSSPSGTNCWEGTISGSCTDCNNNTMTWNIKIVVCCDALTHNHTVSLVPISGTACPATTLVSEDAITGMCDPFLVTGCFPTFGACMVCFGDSPSFDVCFDIYETP